MTIRRALACLFCVLPTHLLAAEGLSQCLIEPHQKIELKSPVSAQIAEVLVDRAAVVRKGQPLVTLDALVEQAALASANYRSVMEGQIRSAESRLANARERLRRREELRQQSYVSAQDRDDAAQEARVAEAEVLEAKDNRELAKLETKRLAATVNRYTLKSPINGVVTDRLQNPGELALSGDTASAILKLAQVDPLRVDVVLPVSKYGSIKIGRVVDIRPEAPFSGVYKATVRVVDPVIDSASGTFRVRLEIPNPKGSIPAGVKCSAAL